MMLRAAYDATENSRFLTLQRKAFDWFLGENDLHIPLYDFRSKGCCDGLMPGGVNMNQGAESILSFLVSLLAVVESYAMLDEITRAAEASQESVSLPEGGAVQQPIEGPVSIKSISAKIKSKAKQIKKLT